MAKSESPLVLVADDEPSTLALVASHLRGKGYRVIEANDGDDAWDKACRELPDLVVLDVMMPGMSGWEVCRKIREAVSLAHTGIVMLTGIGETLNELTSPLYGADAYLDKPFQFNQLAEVVKTTLEARQGGALGRPDGAQASSDSEESEVDTGEPLESEEGSTGAIERNKTNGRSATKVLQAAERAAATGPAKAPAKKAPAKKTATKKAPAKKAPAKKAPAARSRA